LKKQNFSYIPINFKWKRVFKKFCCTYPCEYVDVFSSLTVLSSSFYIYRTQNAYSRYESFDDFAHLMDSLFCTRICRNNTFYPNGLCTYVDATCCQFWNFCRIFDNRIYLWTEIKKTCFKLLAQNKKKCLTIMVFVMLFEIIFVGKLVYTASLKKKMKTNRFGQIFHQFNELNSPHNVAEHLSFDL
jgi:hypothetical protein